MAADKNKIAGDCWKRGTEALGKANWDYAIEMFRQSVRLVPDNKMYRETLRGAEEKKYGNNGTGAKMASAKLMGVRGKVKKARLTKNWDDLDTIAEDGLAVNPWDAQLNKDLGDACAGRAEAALDVSNEDRASGFQLIAIYSYLRALKATPNDRELNRSLAKLYEDRRDYRAAISCWEKLRQLDPLDPVPRSKCSQLAAESTIDHANFEDAKSTKDLMADHEVAKRIKSGHEVADGPGMSLEADLQRAIRKEPDNKDHYLKLADLYMRSKQLQEAKQLYQQALDLSGGDVNIREKLEDVELFEFEKAITEAKTKAAQNPTPENKKLAQQYNAKFVRRKIQVLTEREQRYPSDMRLKLELAALQMRCKEYRIAIPLLQKAVTDTRVRGEGLVRLGICFIEDAKPQLARHQLEQSLNEIDHETHPKMYKEAVYLLGTICEQAQDWAEAEKYFSMLLAVDYGYKDAVARLERIQARGK